MKKPRNQYPAQAANDSRKQKPIESKPIKNTDPKKLMLLTNSDDSEKPNH